MKLSQLATIVNRAFQFVIISSEKYHIDESHALKHSLDVYHYANQIYNSEKTNHPYLEEQHPVICASAILLDMCDKKYMEEAYGLREIQKYMADYMSTEHIHAMSDIISTMSYSKVKVCGFPNLENYQLSYHIVREADLLSGYDVTRSIIYQMMHEKYNYTNSLYMANELFNHRAFHYLSDNLFVTDYSKQLATSLHSDARKTISQIYPPT